MGKRFKMITAVDTNILLDILLEDPHNLKHSKELLVESKILGSLIISPVVYSELFTQFARGLGSNKAGKELDSFLTRTGIDFKPFTIKSLERAGIAWVKYIDKRGKEKVKCPKCGKANLLYCNHCKNKISWRNHIITDFLIGGHAQDSANRLLTRDRGYYLRYFPELEIVE